MLSHLVNSEVYDTLHTWFTTRLQLNYRKTTEFAKYYDKEMPDLNHNLVTVHVITYPWHIFIFGNGPILLIPYNDPNLIPTVENYLCQQ